jgi:hypothetical protein
MGGSVIENKIKYNGTFESMIEVNLFLKPYNAMFLWDQQSGETVIKTEDGNTLKVKQHQLISIKNKKIEVHE